MKSCILDPAVLYKYNDEGLVKICAAYLDDTLHAGNKESEIAKQKCQCKNRV